MKTIEVRGRTQPTHQLKYIPQTLTCSELQGGHLCEKQTLQPPSESQIAVLGNNHVERAENRSPGNKWLTTAATCTRHPREQDQRKEVNLSVGCNEGGRSHSWAEGTLQSLESGAGGVVRTQRAQQQEQQVSLGAFPIPSSSLCILCFAIFV